MIRPLLLAVLLAACQPGEIWQARVEPGDDALWLFFSGNLSLEADVREAARIFEEGASCGYDAVALADFKFAFADKMPASYRTNVRRVAAAARSAGLEIIPYVASFGEGRSLLTRDPNMAAALPVRDAPFRVDGRTARVDRAFYPRVKNGSFGRPTKGAPAGWKIEGTGVTFPVRTVDGLPDVFARFAAGAGFGRIVQSVELPPWQAFRLSLDVLAEEDARPSAFEVRADLESQRLIYQELPLRDGAWKRFHLVFNSLEGGSARIRIGVYRRSPGKVSVDNVRLEPAGLLNVLRREDLPVIVRRPDGSTLSEGRDLEEVHDPMLAEITRGRPLSLGHAPPSIRLRSRNAARTGDLLYVSYFHPVVFERYRVTLSLCAPGVDRLLRDQARWMKVLFGAKRSMVDLSEIRLVGYEPSCGSLPGGELVRTALLRAAKALEEEGSRAVVWSDMLDPLAHAKSPYYLVRGGAAGSWQDLPAGMTVVNWNSVARGESLRFFSELGHPQIVSVNETDPRAVQEEAIRLGRETPGVEGFMYTTWRSDYARLCSFAGMTRDSE